MNVEDEEETVVLSVLVGDGLEIAIADEEDEEDTKTKTETKKKSQKPTKTSSESSKAPSNLDYARGEAVLTDSSSGEDSSDEEGESAKGQLISKCPFVVFKSTKKTNEIFVSISALASKKWSH